MNYPDWVPEDVIDWHQRFFSACEDGHTIEEIISRNPPVFGVMHQFVTNNNMEPVWEDLTKKSRIEKLRFLVPQLAYEISLGMEPPSKFWEQTSNAQIAATLVAISDASKTITDILVEMEYPSWDLTPSFYRAENEGGEIEGFRVNCRMLADILQVLSNHANSLIGSEKYLVSNPKDKDRRQEIYFIRRVYHLFQRTFGQPLHDTVVALGQVFIDRGLTKNRAAKLYGKERFPNYDQWLKDFGVALPMSKIFEQSGED